MECHSFRNKYQFTKCHGYPSNTCIPISLKTSCLYFIFMLVQVIQTVEHSAVCQWWDFHPNVAKILTKFSENLLKKMQERYEISPVMTLTWTLKQVLELEESQKYVVVENKENGVRNHSGDVDIFHQMEIQGIAKVIMIYPLGTMSVYISYLMADQPAAVKTFFLKSNMWTSKWLWRKSQYLSFFWGHEYLYTVSWHSVQ